MKLTIVSLVPDAIPFSVAVSDQIPAAAAILSPAAAITTNNHEKKKCCGETHNTASLTQRENGTAFPTTRATVLLPFPVDQSWSSRTPQAPNGT